ncbi:MAG: MBL fold metallo-hydrolase [Myxococcota bacterium]|nr:MBL fold metallo-hydrolase [Myxococcota bacterium]
MKKLYSILGNSQRLDGGAMFGNAPKALWERWTDADDQNRIQLACRSLLVEDAGKVILFETGIGAFFSPKYQARFGVIEREHVLLQNLNAIGYKDSDVDLVVLSHLHFDHAGGLLTPFEEDKESSLLFPNASFLVSEQAWERANNPHARDRASFIPRLQHLLKDSKRLHLYSGENSPILGPDYTFHYSNGHTPGLLCTEIQTEIGPILFGADLIPGVPWVRESITMGYDRFPELLIDEKTKLLAHLYQRNGFVFFTHDPDCCMAKVTKNERGRFTAGKQRPSLQGLFA